MVGHSEIEPCNLAECQIAELLNELPEPGENFSLWQETSHLADKLLKTVQMRRRTEPQGA